MREFAEEAGLSAWTLYDWRRRLLSRPGTEAKPSPPKLIEVVLAEPEQAVAVGLVVRLSNSRHRIEAPPGFDGDELRRLVEVLESC